METKKINHNLAKILINYQVESEDIKKYECLTHVMNEKINQLLLKTIGDIEEELTPKEIYEEEFRTVVKRSVIYINNEHELEKYLNLHTKEEAIVMPPQILNFLRYGEHIAVFPFYAIFEFTIAKNKTLNTNL